MNPSALAFRVAVAPQTVPPTAPVATTALPPPNDGTTILEVETGEENKPVDDMEDKEEKTAGAKHLTREDIKAKIARGKNRRAREKKRDKCGRNKEAYVEMKALEETKLVGSGVEVAHNCAKVQHETAHTIAKELNVSRHVATKQAVSEGYFGGASVLGNNAAPLPARIISPNFPFSTISSAEEKTTSILNPSRIPSMGYGPTDIEVHTLSLDNASFPTIKTSFDAINDDQGISSNMSTLNSEKWSPIDFESHPDFGSYLTELVQHSHEDLPTSGHESNGEDDAAQSDDLTIAGRPGCAGCADLRASRDGTRDTFDAMFQMFKDNAKASHNVHAELLVALEGSHKELLDSRDKHTELLKQIAKKGGASTNEVMTDITRKLLQSLAAVNATKDIPERTVLVNTLAGRSAQLYESQKELKAEKVKNEELTKSSGNAASASSPELIDLQQLMDEKDDKLKTCEADKKADDVEKDALKKQINTLKTIIATIERSFSQQTQINANVLRQFDAQTQNNATLQEKLNGEFRINAGLRTSFDEQTQYKDTLQMHFNQLSQQLSTVEAQLELEMTDKKALLAKHKQLVCDSANKSFKMQRQIDEQAQALKNASTALEKEKHTRIVSNNANAQVVLKLQQRIDEQSAASEIAIAELEEDKSVRTLYNKATAKTILELQQQIDQQNTSCDNSIAQLEDKKASRTLDTDTGAKTVLKMQQQIDEQKKTSENAIARLEEEKAARRVLFKQNKLDELTRSVYYNKLNRTLRSFVIYILFANIAALFAGPYYFPDTSSQTIIPASTYNDITNVETCSKWDSPLVAELVLLTQTPPERRWEEHWLMIERTVGFHNTSLSANNSESGDGNDGDTCHLREPYTQDAPKGPSLKKLALVGFPLVVTVAAISFGWLSTQ